MHTATRSLWLPPLAAAARRASRPTPYDAFTARNGTPVFVRPIRDGDAPLLQALFDGLSPASRVRRFHAGVVSLPQPWLDRLSHPDERSEFALLALVVERGREVPIGEARYALDDAPLHEREFALTVADAWQRQGIGAELLGRLEDHARGHAVRRLRGDVQYDNLPMIGLLRARGYRIVRHPGDAGLLRATVGLAPDARPADVGNLPGPARNASPTPHSGAAHGPTGQET